MKKFRFKWELNGYVYEFNVDYKYLNPPDTVKNMPHIHNYFMIEYSMKWKHLDLFKKYFS